MQTKAGRLLSKTKETCVKAGASAVLGVLYAGWWVLEGVLDTDDDCGELFEQGYGFNNEKNAEKYWKSRQ